MNIRTQRWNDLDIRFVERDSEWWIVLDDLNKALKLNSFWTHDIPPTEIDIVNIDGRCVDIISEIGIYEKIASSDATKARKFRHWTSEVIQKLRKAYGLEQYEVLRMLDSDVQEDINNILDTIFYDEEKGKLMKSITVANGDVEIIEF